MRANFLVAVAISAIATIAMGQSRSTNIPTQSEAHSQSLDSRDTFVPSRDPGKSPTPDETKAINSASDANNIVNSTMGNGTPASQSSAVPTQAVSDDTVKSVTDEPNN